MPGSCTRAIRARTPAGSRWREISEKLDTFFEAFIKQLGATVESTPCPCAICRNGDKLGLKIVVHAGEAVFMTWKADCKSPGRTSFSLIVF